MAKSIQTYKHVKVKTEDILTVAVVIAEMIFLRSLF